MTWAKMNSRAEMNSMGQNEPGADKDRTNAGAKRKRGLATCIAITPNPHARENANHCTAITNDYGSHHVDAAAVVAPRHPAGKSKQRDSANCGRYPAISQVPLGNQQSVSR